MSEKEFVPYPEALELKQLGFDIPSVSGFSYPDSDSLLTQAILYQQAFSWFREHPEWPIDSWIQPHLSQNPKQYEGFYWRRGEKVSVGIFSTYDAAELNLLRKLIEIVKTNQ